MVPSTEVNRHMEYPGLDQVQTAQERTSKYPDKNVFHTTASLKMLPLNVYMNLYHRLLNVTLHGFPAQDIGSPPKYPEG